MQRHPGIDRTLIEEHIRLGYTEGEIKDILKALERNASTAGMSRKDPKHILWINRALAAIIRRFQDALNNGQYDDLLSDGYTQDEIRDILFTNLLSTKQLLDRTESAHDSGEYDRLHQLGYTDVQIRSLIRAGFTVSQLRALADRINGAQRNGVDSQGLTVQRIDDMLFKDRPINGKQTLGIVRALLSGIDSKVREGDVARCIIDYATMFDVPYGLGGTHGQVDVGTQRIIIEAKVDSVTDGQLGQYLKIMTNDIMNPPDVTGKRKSVILYAPGYGEEAVASITKSWEKGGVGGYVARSCEQLHKQIRELGGP